MTSAADNLRNRRLGIAGRLRGRALTGRWLRLFLMLGLPLIVVLAGLWWYLTSGRYVTTDDAYVRADMVSVSANVSGRVVAVDVGENEHVAAGQVLLRLDDQPYRIAVEQAEAQLASAKLQVEGLRATYRQRQADLAAAQETFEYQQREYERQEKLLQGHVISQAQIDQTRNRLETARQQVAAAQQQIANVLASLGGDANIATEDHPMVKQASAQLHQAELNLSYTVVRAPSSGIVTNVNKLPVGNYLSTATPAFSLVETDAPWIEANFKETELTHMKAGDAATVTVDAYPGIDFKGHVASLSPATGAEFSVLPPQNASGNWVKVVQRLPVRIVVDAPDPDRPLRAGMSVSATIDTRYESPIAAKLAAIF